MGFHISSLVIDISKMSSDKNLFVWDLFRLCLKAFSLA